MANSNDQEVVIRITASNLTSAAFAQARQELAGLQEKAQDTAKGTSGAFDTIKNAIEHPTEALKQLGTSLTASVSGMGAAGVAAVGLAGVALAAGLALFALGKQAVALGAELNDFSEKTSISVESAYRLKYVADVTGSSLEQMSGVIFMMQRRMSDSPQEFEKGLKNIGLNIAEIQNLKPDEQIYAISRAFQENTDQSNRASTAMALFGKQGRDFIPILMKDLAGLNEEARKLGKFTAEDAKAAEELTMAWNKLWAQLGRYKTEIGLGVVHWWQDLTRSLQAYKDLLDSITGKPTQLPTIPKLAKGGGNIDLSADTAEGKRIANTYTGGGILNPSDDKQLAALEAIGAYQTGLAEEQIRLKKEAAAIQKKTDEEEAKAWDYKMKAQEEILKSMDKAQVQAGFLAEWQRRHVANLQSMGQQILERHATYTGGATSDTMPGQFAEQEQRRMQEYLHPSITAGFGNVISKDLPQTILAAVTGGGNPFEAAGSLMGSKLGTNAVSKFGGLITSHLGETLGGALNTVIPGIGAMIGPAIGKLWSMIKGIGGPSKEEVAARDSQTQMIQQLRAMATEGERTEGALKDNYHTIAIVARDAYMKTGASAAEAERHVAALLDTGHPAAFKAAMEDLNRVISDQKQDDADLNAAIKEYGFSIEELGPKMRKQQLTEEGIRLENQWRLLIGAEIDAGVVTDKMSEKLNSYLHDCMKTGTEVPKEFQPIVQKLIDMGELTDENGNKVTSLEGSGVKFSETFTQAADRIVVALQQIAKGLGVDIPDAMSKIPRTVDIDVTERRHFTSDDPGESPDFPGHAAGGLFSRPHLARIAEGGEPELVGSQSFMTTAVAAALARVNGGQPGNGGTRAVMEQMQASFDKSVKKIERSVSEIGSSVSRAVRDGMLVAR